MDKFIAFLIVVLILLVAAVTVPLTHEVVITTNRSLFGMDVGGGSVYRVRFCGTVAEYYDNEPIIKHLLDGVDCTPDAITAAYTAAGFTDVSVIQVSL